MELMEDDVFFTDLSKQISLLINDDEEDIRFPAQCPALPLQQQQQRVPQAMLPPAYAGGYLEGDYRTGCKGTCVFIPRSTLPRRKTRSARANCSVRSSSNSNSNSNSSTNSSTKRPSLGK